MELDRLKRRVESPRRITAEPIPLRARACSRLNHIRRFRLDRIKGSSYNGAVGKTLLHGLFPVVRAEVLQLLFTNPRPELYVRELARLSFLSLQTVQDELAKLEAEDLTVHLARSHGSIR